MTELKEIFLELLVLELEEKVTCR